MYKDLPYPHIYCMGIGGIGVSGLAELLHSVGYKVSGSDVSENDLTRYLRSLGIVVYTEHVADHIKDVDLVVHTSAVCADHAVLVAAKAAGVPTLSRGELLARVMKANCNVVIAGTHGKTTTTALASYVFEKANTHPTCLIGGVLRDRLSPFHLGSSDFFIAEADESDASFLFLSPTVAIITNIDLDHMETYAHDFVALKKSFLKVVEKIPSHGFVVTCIDDPVVRELLPQMACRVVTYGTSEDADYRLENFKQDGLNSYFQLNFPRGDSLPAKLQLPGIHNALNAIAAVAAGCELQCDKKQLVDALAQFPGVGRRFHYRGEIKLPLGMASLFDDYGHHPKEIFATITAAKQAWPNRRLVVIFQPHRYSRTRDLMTEFVDVLKNVDQLILTDVYAASEAYIVGADSQALYDRILQAGGKNSQYVVDMNTLPACLPHLLKPEDVVILQGAGNIVTMAEALLAM